MSSLFISILQQEEWDMAYKLLEKNPEVVNDVDVTTGNAAIFYALPNPDMIKRLLAAKPTLIDSKTSLGNNALAHGVQTCAPFESLSVLVQTKKKCVANKNMTGKVALHYAAALGPRATVELINLLVAAYPTGAAEKEKKNGSYPLHYACAFKATCAVIDALASAYPSTTMETDDAQNLPIHLAIIKGVETDAILKLIEISPESVAVKDGKGRLPIHLALAFDASPKTVEALILAYPESLAETDATGRLPIHLAFKYKVYLETIEMLIRYDTTIMSLGGEKGKKVQLEGPPTGEVPATYCVLHSAIDYGCGGDVINVILKVQPATVKQWSEDGKLPLHFACWKQASLGVMKALVRAFPDACWVKDGRYANLPLHYAAQYRLDLYAANYVFTAYPEAALVRNCSGKLPIHLAAKYNAHFLFVNALVKGHPFSPGIPDLKGKLPLDYALEYGACAETICILMGISKVNKKKKEGNTPGKAVATAGGGGGGGGGGRDEKGKKDKSLRTRSYNGDDEEDTNQDKANTDKDAGDDVTATGASASQIITDDEIELESMKKLEYLEKKKKKLLRMKKRRTAARQGIHAKKSSDKAGNGNNDQGSDKEDEEEGEEDDCSVDSYDSFDPIEYKKLHGIIRAAETIGSPDDHTSLHILPVGKGGVDKDGKMIFGTTPFDKNDCFGDNVPVASFQIENSGVRGLVCSLKMQLKVQADEIVSHRSTIDKLKAEISEKDLEIKQLKKDLNWARDKIARMEEAMPKGVVYASNKFTAGKAATQDDVGHGDEEDI